MRKDSERHGTQGTDLQVSGSGLLGKTMDAADWDCDAPALVLLAQ